MATNDNSTITVGILIPTYDRSHYLEKALTSAAGQTHYKLDIIVIDNGSTDGTAEFMTSVSDPRVRYVVNETNIGMIRSINKGIKLFSDNVTWCTILPDDDLLDNDFIASMVDYVHDHPLIDIVYSHRFLIDESGRRIAETRCPPKKETSLDFLINRARFTRDSFLAGIFFSRAAYENIGGYPQFTSGMASDDALIFAMSMQHGLYFNRKAIASVRMHSEAESVGYTDLFRHLEAFDDFRSYIRNVVKQRGHYLRRQIRAVDCILKSYMRSVISGLWLTRVQHYLIHDRDSSKSNLADLYAVAVTGRYPFSIRVRFDGFLATKCRSYPERYMAYRLGWGLWFLLFRVFLRIIPAKILRGW